MAASGRDAGDYEFVIVTVAGDDWPFTLLARYLKLSEPVALGVYVTVPVVWLIAPSCPPAGRWRSNR